MRGQITSLRCLIVTLVAVLAAPLAGAHRAALLTTARVGPAGALLRDALLDELGG